MSTETSYKIEICDHPAQARNPINKNPMVKDGKKVPLFPELKCVKLDGTIIAYVNKHRDISFLLPSTMLGEIQKDVEQLVASELGEAGNVSSIPDPLVENDDLEDDDLIEDE